MSDEYRKDKLRSMLDNMVDNNDEQTQVDFHQYATSKLQNMLGYEPVDTGEIDGEAEAESFEEVEVEVPNMDNEFQTEIEVED